LKHYFQGLVETVREGKSQEIDATAVKLVSLDRLLNLDLAPFADLGRTDRAMPNGAASLQIVIMIGI
jgi:hypothetical protein